MTHKDLTRSLAEILEVSADEIIPERSLSQYASWDSLAAVSFIAMAYDLDSRTVTARQLEACKTIDDLCRLFPDIQTDEI